MFAESMGEIRRIDTGIYPAPNAISNSKSNIGGGANAADEKGILAAVWARAFVFAVLEYCLGGVEVEDVGFGVEATIFRGEGGGDAV